MEPDSRDDGAEPVKNPGTSARPATHRGQELKHYQFEELADGFSEVCIWLASEKYTLKRTRAGKLVLHK